MSDLREYKCPACGGAMEFDSGSQKMKCPFCDTEVSIEEFMKDKKGLIPNVDFYSATVYHTLGIDSDIFTLIFAMSRVAGWIAHIQEQQKNNKLIRPRSQYIGQENMTYIPLEKR